MTISKLARSASLFAITSVLAITGCAADSASTPSETVTGSSDRAPTACSSPEERAELDRPWQAAPQAPMPVLEQNAALGDPVTDGVVQGMAKALAESGAQAGHQGTLPGSEHQRREALVRHRRANAASDLR